MSPKPSEVLSLVFCILPLSFGYVKNENSAKIYLDHLEIQMSRICRLTQLAVWEYETNINEKTQKEMVEEESREADFIKNMWYAAKRYDWKNFQDKYLKRQFELMSVIGAAALDYDDFIQYKNIISNMEGIFSSTTICDRNHSCGLNLEPEITEIMIKSRDYDELLYIWQEWHDKVGKPMRHLYPQYVHWANVGAEANGFKDNAELWLHEYEIPNFDKKMENIMIEMKPFYEQLHAYVRRKLSHVYKDKIQLDGSIPAHLFGDMWAQDWENIEQIVRPFAQKSSVDATLELKRQGYTVKKMFETSEDFYTSLNLEPLPRSFWNLSMLERPSDGRNVTCHAAAYDFCDGVDFRIRMCATITMEDFITMHHEMGHIQYFQQYKDFPFVFREGANPGFHEAVGDTIALSVGSPSHLKRLNLLPQFVDDSETEINFLMSIALQKIAFLPFAYVVDLWRWKVFRDEIKDNEYNDKWWELRQKYEGIIPPVKRSEINFDPGAKYHIASDTEYLRYFVSAILQFQFHKSLCIAANEYDPDNSQKPLHKCDIYKNLKAGQLLKEMLKFGRSQTWPKTLKQMTGSEHLDPSAMLEYFKPLNDYLIAENKKTNEYIGWKNAAGKCTSTLFIITFTFIVNVFVTSS